MGEQELLYFSSWCVSPHAMHRSCDGWCNIPATDEEPGEQVAVPCDCECHGERD